MMPHSRPRARLALAGWPPPSEKVLASFGSGGAWIDARLLSHTATPGSPLRGEILLLGDEVGQEINSLAVNLLTRVQVPTERPDPGTEDLVCGTKQLTGREYVRAGQQVKWPGLPGAFTVEHNQLAATNWEQRIEGWLHEVAKPRGIFD